jgi:glycerol kinase
MSSTGLPLSTYFSAVKLRWMIDNYPDVAKAHNSDDLLFGTVESWVAYVCLVIFISWQGRN